MHIVRVIPYATLPPSVPQVLEYFWPEPLARGSVVRAPLGRREIRAVVIGSAELSRAKMTLRGARFQTRRLSSVEHPQPQVTGVQLALAEWMTDQYAVGPGTALRAACPLLCPVPEVEPATAPVRLAYRLSDPRHTIRYLRKIATAGPIYVLVPDIATAEILAERLGFPAVHSGLGARRFRILARSAAGGSLTGAVGTRVGLFLPWASLTHVVVEDPVNEIYKQERSPRYSAVDVARQLAQYYGASFMLFAAAPVITAEHLVRSGRSTRITQRPTSSISSVPVGPVGQSLLSAPVRDAIREAIDARTTVLIFSARKGYASSAVCRRCRAPALCASCAIPRRLWRRASDEMLVCYRCGSFTDVPARCDSCGEGTLRPAGFGGSQRLAEEVSELAGDEVPVLDGDLVRTSAERAAVWRRYDALAAPIVVASSLVFPERYRRTFGTVIVPDVDALATSPDFRTTERVLATLEKLLDFGPRRMLIQHRGQDSVVDAVARRDWEPVMRDELKDRKFFGWPPFARLALLKVTGRGRTATQRQAGAIANRMQRVIASLRVGRLVTLQGPSPAWMPRRDGRWTEHILISSSAAAPVLAQVLAHVPGSVAVDIDPRSIA